MISSCLLPWECRRYWFKVLVQIGYSSELTLILPVDCANQWTALLELSIDRRLNQQTRKIRNFMPLNVREILCNELLLDFKITALSFLQHTHFSGLLGFSGLCIGLFPFYTISAIETVPEKRLFFLYQNWSIPKKTCYELAYMTEELLCWKIPNASKLRVRNASILRAKLIYSGERKRKWVLGCQGRFFKLFQNV